MARWSFPTLLEPDRWAALVGFHPCHWNGVGGVVDNRSCADTWFQYIWQMRTSRAGRETVGQAVYSAEQRMAAKLGFAVAPEYVTNDEVEFPCHGAQVRASRGYVRAVGVEARDDIQQGAAIAYTDEDGDGLLDTGTVSVTVPAGTDPCEIAVYYAGVVSAAVIAPGDETWRVKPLEVVVSGTTATITGHRCQFVLWSVHEAADELDPLPDISDDANFMTTVDVYRRYTAPAGGVTAIWYNDGYCSDPACDETEQNICGRVVNERLGHLRYSFASYSSGAWARVNPALCRYPDRLRLNYLAGWRAVGTKGCDTWGELAEIVVRLSLTLLREDICQCSGLSWLWSEARENLASTDPVVVFRSMPAILEMYGTTMRGALDAYNFTVDNMLTQAGVLTR